ncbi:hypothetical protein [Streptomyces sp. NBC_00690]|uniref:hypothetical protein n=1 Tax=Streptomyces sp. NBC_00690 TaxID=2975808 RepID=UPI002E2E1997|nr:hypothetical protein [Streptomyces sp. NBC_00690]
MTAESRKTPEASLSDWDRQLVHAFGVLVGRPLDEFDPAAVYAVGLQGNALNESGFLREPDWVHPKALSGARPIPCPFGLSGEPDRQPLFDPSTSIFDFGRCDSPQSPLPKDFTTALKSVCFAGSLVRGADIAPLLDRFGVDLTTPALKDTWEIYFPRLVCDGTLLDALRVALDTGRTPEELVPLTLTVPTEPEEEWEQDLATIEHPALRTHLAYFCTDGAEGLMPLYQDETTTVLEDEGCEPIAGWEDGHGQIEITVMRLSPLVSGPAQG